MLERFGIQTDEAIANILATVFRMIIIMLGFVTVAREWNYDISAFIASLSIGSLAVAFAAKDALANVFGSMIILLDKPFKIGDWIKANSIEGIVESVSFRSTCIRTFPQELVYIPNSLLSNTPITNYTLRERRRIDFTLGLTYGTTAAQIEEFIFKLKIILRISRLLTKMMYAFISLPIIAAALISVLSATPKQASTSNTSILCRKSTCIHWSCWKKWA